MTTSLDTRTWIAWGFAAMLPLLIGRNPWITLEILIIVFTIRAVAVPPKSSQSLRWFVRIAAIMATISVVFNLLTVHSGDRTIGTLPDSWPVIGGPLSLNALIYGLVSGLTIFVLVCSGLTISALIRWIDLFHILPRRLAPIAMTGSVAWAFLPQTAIAWTNIRETMAMRGQCFRRPGDFLPIVIPLMASGLDRSLTMAEALEARGFGVSISARAPSRSRWLQAGLPILLSAGLVGLMLAMYLLATGGAALGLLALGVSLVAMIVFLRASPPPAHEITRYQTTALSKTDLLVIMAALLAVVVTLVSLWLDLARMTITIYPSLTWPTPNLPVMIALSPLMLPAYLLVPKADSL